MSSWTPRQRIWGQSLIATAGQDKTIKLRNAVPPVFQALATLQGDKEQPWFALYAPDGRGLATGGKDKAVRLRDPGAGRTKGTFPGRFSRIHGVALSPDGKTLASACQDKTVLIWDLATRTVKATLEGHKLPVLQVAFAPDGKTLASAGGNPNNFNPEEGLLGELKLWEMASGHELLSFKGHTGSIKSVAFGPDSMRLASGSGDHTVKVWEGRLLTGRLTAND